MDVDVDKDKDKDTQLVRQQVGIGLPRAKHHLPKDFKAEFSRKCRFGKYKGTKWPLESRLYGSWREVVSCLWPT